MKLFYATLCILLLASTTLKCRESADVTLEESVLSLNFLAPGFSAEFGLNAKSSLYFQGGLGFTFLIESSNNGSNTEFVAQPFILGQFRNYFNLEKRSLLNKNTDYNSGNYVGIMVGHTFEPIAGNEDDLFSTRTGTSLGPIWGLQRNGVISFGFSLGIGLLLYTEDVPVFTNGSTVQTQSTSGSQVTLLGSFNLGLNLSKIGKNK